MLLFDFIALGGAGAVASAAAFNPDAVKLLSRSLLNRQRTYMVNAPTTEFKTVSKTVDGLRIRAENAAIFVRRVPDASEIKLLSNFPTLWTIEAGELMQRANPSASLLKGDDCSRLTFSGLLGAAKDKVEPDLVEIVDDSNVKVNTKPLSLIFRKVRLEIVLPDTYRGDLEILCKGETNVYFEHDWIAGALKIENSGKGRLDAKSIRETKSVTLVDGGAFNMFIEDIKTASLTVSLNSGTFKANDITAEKLVFDTKSSPQTTFRNIVVTETAQMSYRHGSAAALTADLIDCKSLDLKLDGTGNVEVSRIRGAACGVWHSGRGVWNVLVNECTNFKFQAAGGGAFKADTMRCAEKALIDIAPGSDCRLDISGSIESENLEMQLRGKAGASVKTIKGGNCSLVLGSKAETNLQEVTLRSVFTSEQTSSGGLTIANIQAKEVNSTTSDRGNLTIPWIDSYDAKLTTSGQGQINVQNGKVVELDLQCTGRGDLNFYADYKSITMKRNNAGKVNFKNQVN